jgi:hypothetical protein
MVVCPACGNHGSGDEDEENIVDWNNYHTRRKLYNNLDQDKGH